MSLPAGDADRAWSRRHRGEHLPGQVTLPRGLIFGLLCIACLIIASAYAAIAMRRASSVVPAPAPK